MITDKYHKLIFWQFLCSQMYQKVQLVVLERKKLHQVPVVIVYETTYFRKKSTIT